MTSDRGFFSEFKKDVVVEVTLADGTKTRSAGCGSGVLFGVNGEGNRIAITLEYVLFVPALEGGLISVRKLALKGFDVVFKVNHCEIKSADGVVVAVGEMQANQYVLKMAEACMVATGNHTDECQHTWHRRMGHRDMDVMGVIQSKELADGLKTKDCGERIVCECCLKGKLARNPFPQATERKSKQPLDLVHTDLCGPMDNPTPSGNKYFMTMIDDYSRFCVVFLLKSKSEAASKIEEYVRWTENLFGRKPCVVRSDGGGEYTAEHLQSFYRAEGIRAQFSTPYSPQSNGVAERKNRSLQEMANCMLLDADLPKRYWGEAVLTAAYVQNRLPSRVVDRTPFELWTGVKPDLSRLRVFGCEAYVHIPDVKRKKFEPKAKKLVFVGYSDHHKGYRFVDRETDRITVSRDARFMELSNGSQQQEEKLKEPESTVEPEAALDPEAAVDPESAMEPEEDRESECEVLLEQNGRDQAAEEPEEPEESVYEDADSEEDLEEDFYGFDEAELVPLRREHRWNRGVLPIRFRDYLVGQVSHEEEPSDHREAMRVPEWRKAMCEELDAHKVNQTWELVKLPVGKKFVGAKWVFKLKRNELGEVVKHKARIVAQGYTQRFGVDYSEVFAPVTRQTTLRAMLAVAGKKGLLLKQYDVKTAYLNGTIDEELYMRQPPGFEEAGRDMVCKLRKSIYGLKQSARCWNRALHAVLLDLGFVQCDSDSCLYVRRSEQGTVYLLVYVDDLLMGCTDEAEMDRIYEELRKRFDVTSLGPVRHFLGHEIGKEEGYYTLRLTAYIDHLVQKFGMEDAHPVKTPMDPGYTTLNEGSKPFPDKTLYRSLVGALLYLSVNARPDLAISVGLLGRKVSDPNCSDWNAAKRALQYLKATKAYKLKFSPVEGWKLTGYSDSDWAGDKRTRRSTTGYVFFYGGGPICWTSKGQDCVALSSLEAEYNALTLTCQEAVWLRRLLGDLDEPQSGATTVYEDNQGCLCFAKAEPVVA